MSDPKKPGLPGQGASSGTEPKIYSRRQFLQGTALTAAGAVVVTSGVAAILWPDAASAPTDTPAPTTPTTPTTPAPGTVKLPSYVTPVRAKGFINVDAKKCVGCRLCETECAIFHLGTWDIRKSNIRVHYYNPPVDIPIVCQQCEDAPCMAACPPKVAAISRNEETGAYQIDYDKCTGCGLCIEACRTGTLRLDEEAMVPVGMCDLCGGGQPSCVGVCPSGALAKVTTSVSGWMFADKPEKIAQQLATGLYNR